MPEELVTVQIAPGRWQKMTRAQAAAAGYDLPGDEPDTKTREPANKARKAPAKAPAKKAAPRRSGGTRRSTRGQ